MNDKCYVGQHKNVLTVEGKRWAGHIYTATRGKHQSYIHCAIRKHGAENFSAEILWCGLPSKLNEKEIFFIKKLHTFIDDPKGGGYNLTIGGGGVSVWADSSRKKASDSQLRRFEDPVECARMSAIAIRRFKKS